MFKEVGPLKVPTDMLRGHFISPDRMELGVPVGEHHAILSPVDALALLDWLAAATGHYPEREGWKLVPVKANEAMCRAGEMWMKDGSKMSRLQWAFDCYEAMLSAAPAQPAAIQQGEGE